ncbi:hypothetical protein HIM_10848 [Hirsutella minnesotensis 3608]|uniref:Uncharacterized protein n=1 Tax=Hirsutella minnesotensis 3608 TaxID=1043627 RepID=A0A0F7ZJM7_9HYPO|nr:hypothetical protein HIM_10848 [Hirsutella minnesotensis 3608]
MSQEKPEPRITELAVAIGKSVKSIQDALTAQGSESPSFDEDAPARFPREISDARDTCIDAALELVDLLLEPMTSIFKHGAHNNSICLQAISRFSIASMVPPGGTVSFAEVADRTGLSEQLVRRLLRHAMTMRIFREPEPGLISHTRSSRMLRNPIVNDWIKCGTNEMWPAAPKMLDAAQKWPGSSEPNETGFSLANGGDTLYSIMGRDPERAAAFSNAMKIFSLHEEFDPSYIVEHYDWHSLGRVQVVDIGGSRGHIAVAIARRFDNVRVLVQDMEHVVAGVESQVPDEVKDRVRFMAHDMFSLQTVEADVYFFRWVFHNWSDEYCTRILRAQIPVLKPGVIIIIQESLMPESGKIPIWRERDMRSNDIHMGMLFNARERTVEEWKDLLQKAHPGFVLKRHIEPKNSALGILEVTWSG